ncbi:MAG: HEAT repeat domain-containing protein [bacterium]|nr:HEAT repeat domain-containing protein [bacterium]
MADPMTLLSDDQIQQFIADGYLAVRADFPDPFHREVYQKIEAVFEAEGNLGNNILPRIPQIGQVYEHPLVKGALTSLLGPGYIMNPHRHCHLNPPGRAGQRWHKDCYVYDHNLRHPRFYWVLGFYYPQETTEDMGPTGILPGKHMLKEISDADPARATERALKLCGPAGTVAFVHFDVWHRATENVSDKNRYMLKFQFARTAEPGTPTWDHRDRQWKPRSNDAFPEVSKDVWHWLCGDPNGKGKPAAGALKARAISESAKGSETDRLKSAYQIAARGGPAVSELIAEMREETLAALGETEAKTADNAHGTNPTIGIAAHALSVMGAPAVPELTTALKDDHWWVRAVAANVLARMGATARPAEKALLCLVTDTHWWVRRNAIEALGMIGVSSDAFIRTLVPALADEDYRVRRNAALAASKIGRAAHPAIPQLRSMLTDENRYNRFYAALALRRIATPEAQNILLDHLMQSRWCPITTKDNTY